MPNKNWSVHNDQSTGLNSTMQNLSVNDYLRKHIRTVPDWPVPGVQFREITPLLQ